MLALRLRLPARLAVAGDEVLNGEHVRERMRRGTRFRGRGSGILLATMISGVAERRRQSVPVEEPPRARWHKPHHTTGVA
jgi:hypothetical protein